MLMTTISFTAERVSTWVENFTETFRVHGVAFEAGDPDSEDGEGWNFSRSSEDDDGVCTVREIQRATLYDGIQDLHLSRTLLLCTFEPGSVDEAGCARLEIHLELDDETWEIIARMMSIVCAGKPFFRREA